MQIQVQQLTQSNAYQYVKVEVEFHSEYRGYGIYRDADGWLYIKYNGYWNYFINIREARKFVRDIIN